MIIDKNLPFKQNRQKIILKFICQGKTLDSIDFLCYNVLEI